MKRHVLENETVSTLKKNYDIWEERPRILHSEITTESDFSHMVHHLEAHNQILHIVMGMAKENDPEQPSQKN